MATRAAPSGLSISDADIALIRGMIARGDRNHDIASFFGVNQGRIAEIKGGAMRPEIEPANDDNLPPEGPYLTPKATWQENRLL